VSPRATNLYRTVRSTVILAAFGLMLAQMVPAQSAGRKGPPNGPRALGLLQLTPNGKAHLIPITILYDGQFYDASAYKAAPVPIALESGTVYEAVRTGVSQGLFTVSSALQANNTWIGDGTWQSASALAAAAAKKKEARSKPAPEPVEGPPVLRRASAAKAPEPPPSAPPAGSNPPPTASAPASATSTPAAAPPAPTPAPPVPEDPDRPVLKRGAPSPAELKKQSASASMSMSTPTSTPAKGGGHAPSTFAAAAASAVRSIPAISDADGPDPRPYAYDLKPEEEQKLRKTILALAADEVRARATQLAAGPVGSPPAAHSSSHQATRAKLPQPSFEDMQLRVFDLSNSNEPILVLTTKARMPSHPNATGADLQYIVTLVARDDIYGELHKAFASVTDTQHLDVLPRLELIDAVDADGDGRGELLFRQVSDAGQAFVLYRVIGDRLWPLFEGTPGE
jgi:hypothetical protein